MSSLESNEGEGPMDEPEDPTLIPASEVNPLLDILCRAGCIRKNQQANANYRALISSSKGQFKTLSSARDREAFAANTWDQLQAKQYRFLKPTPSGRYEILDRERAVKKCFVQRERLALIQQKQADAIEAQISKLFRSCCRIFIIVIGLAQNEE